MVYQGQQQSPIKRRCIYKFWHANLKLWKILDSGYSRQSLFDERECTRMYPPNDRAKDPLPPDHQIGILNSKGNSGLRVAACAVRMTHCFGLSRLVVVTKLNPGIDSF